MIRIGQGYDVHRLCTNRKLIIGGVKIPYAKGLSGHSDADVLLHAISDALLGAAAMGDIGQLFPDTDLRYKDANSLELLKAVAKNLNSSGYRIINIDSTIIAEEPKLLPFISLMRENIAMACELELGTVGVKATTEEGLGFTGQGEGIAASAVCLLEKFES